MQQVMRSGVHARLYSLHDQLNDEIHGSASFLPWHRYFLYILERQLQRYDKSVTVPYWNWAYDSQAPEMAHVFDADAFGGNGVGQNGCITDGAFKSYRPPGESPACIVRSFNGRNNRIGALYSVEAINRLVTSSGDYDTFRINLEGTPHAAVHNGVGGTMATMKSPMDPLFYLHHAYVDKVWADWQNLNEDHVEDYGGQNGDGSDASPDDALAGSTVTVSQMFYTEDLCYTYQDITADQVNKASKQTGRLRSKNVGSNLVRRAFLDAADFNNANSALIGSTSPDEGETQKDATMMSTNKGVADPDDRKELVALRKPSSVPDRWFELNNFPVQYARQQEADYANLVAQLNRLTGYVSPCALWRREELWKRVLVHNAKQRTHYTCNVGGTQVTVPVPTQIPVSTMEGAAKAVQTIMAAVRSQVPSGHLQDTSDAVTQQLMHLIGQPVIKTSSLTCPFHNRTLTKSDEDSEEEGEEGLFMQSPGTMPYPYLSMFGGGMDW
jgi:tyrosinase